ncbi:MAG: hypothetical protein A2231_09755 [Candidatus Firestonebacteria bacterium RIFOXYA2_FULL_40_8]|nr:MAG: hypothetical protein A2231_09755 [Candidatus Firestonebacteria bacterium RIFOXYA2_FULL_40_8]
MYKQIYDKVFSEFSGETAKQNLINIYHSDVRSDYKAFKETAEWCCNKMREAGLSEVEILYHKADGVSKLGVAAPPEAWDAYDATLEILLPNGESRILADYGKNPLSLAMYSAPTKGVVETEIVDLESIKSPSELKGKIVLSSKRGKEIAEYVMKNKAAGLVLDMVSEPCRAGKVPKEQEAVYWENGCFRPKNKYKGFAFVISSEAGEKLRKLLKNNKIKAKAFVNTKIYAGSVGTVTGIIPGSRRKDKEILLVSHLYEVGANDNASGSAVSLETARTLVNLIGKGVLPQPKRSIRFVLGYEIFGLLSFFNAKKENISNTIAGLNLDMVGEDEDITGAVLNIGKTPPSNPSFANDLILCLLRESLKWKACRFEEKNYEMADNDSFISEPAIGIQTPYLMYTTDRFYHSSKDTPDKVSVVSLKRAGVIAGTYLYLLATAEIKECSWLAEEAAAGAKIRVIRALQNLLSSPGDLKKGIKQIDHLIDIEERGLNSVPGIITGDAWSKHYVRQIVQKLSYDFKEAISGAYKDILKKIPPAKVKPLKGSVLTALNKVIPVKSFNGLPLRWVLSEKDAENFAKLSAIIPGVSCIEILSWINGKRTLLEIFNLLKIISEPEPEALLRWFKSAKMYKYVKLEKNNRITKAALVKDLKKLGIKKGDVLMVHSSLGSIGVVEGGADTVVNALVTSVSGNGMVVVPTLTATGVNDLYAFNPRKTPSRVGEITNALINRPDSFRSVHPTHSLGAVGKGAEEFVKGHDKSTFSEESPYGKYVRKNAKILFIGTGIGCNTTLHAVEDWLDLPYLTTGKAVIEDEKGRDKTVKITKCPAGCRDFYGKKDTKIKKVFEKKGIMKKGKLGNAEVILITARDVVNTTVREIENGNLDILLCNRPDCKFCNNGRKLLKKKQPQIMKNIETLRKIGLYGY